MLKPVNTTRWDTNVPPHIKVLLFLYIAATQGEPPTVSFLPSTIFGLTSEGVIYCFPHSKMSKILFYCNYHITYLQIKTIHEFYIVNKYNFHVPGIHLSLILDKFSLRRAE